MTESRKIDRGEALSGLGLGLLTGSLIGLSVAPVVGTVLGALTALLAAYFGLVGPGSPGTRSAGNPVRIACFALAAVVGLTGGLYLRAQNSLSKSPADRVTEWTEAGFDKTTARSLVVYDKVGILPPNWEVADASATEPDASDTILFRASAEQCDRVDPENYPDTAELVHALQAEGKHWKEMAAAVTSVRDVELKRRILVNAWTLACGS